MAPFLRLVRFSDPQGQIHQGEAGAIPWTEDLVGKTVKIFSGINPWDENFHLTDRGATISKVLSPLASVPIIHGIGLNYRAHAEEGQMPIPPFPVVFAKFSDTLAAPYEDIPIPNEALLLDYEGELCVIISKDCKNLSPLVDPLDYVLGYTAGNDVSSRYWQQPERSGAQHGYAKSFDKFAPLGPVISSPIVIPDPNALSLRTWVNGELRQQAKTDDLIFNIQEIIRHMSRGMMLRKGTVIMSGTPNGVGITMTPPAPLKDGDVVEIEIENIGRIRNRMVFEK